MILRHLCSKLEINSIYTPQILCSTAMICERYKIMIARKSSQKVNKPFRDISLYIDFYILKTDQTKSIKKRHIHRRCYIMYLGTLLSFVFLMSNALSQKRICKQKEILKSYRNVKELSKYLFITKNYSNSAFSRNFRPFFVPKNFQTQ